MKILTAAEAADFLKIKSDTLYSLIENDGLPGAKVGNQWRFLEEDLVAWFKQKQSLKLASREDRWQESGIYRCLVEDTFDAVFLSEDNIIFDCNDDAIKLYGFQKEEFIGKPFRELLVPEFHDELHDTVVFQRTGVIQRVHRRRDGTVLPVEVSVKSIDRQGKSVRLGAVRNLSHHDRVILSPKVQQVLDLYNVQSIEPGRLPAY